MTPLAHKVVKEIINPQGIASSEAINPDVLKSVCFEMSEIRILIKDLAEKFFEQGVPSELCFLPAKHTWLEWSYIDEGNPDNGGPMLSRQGVLLSENEDSTFLVENFSSSKFLEFPDHPDVIHCAHRRSVNYGVYSLPIKGGVETARKRREIFVRAAEQGIYQLYPDTIYSALSVINSPKIVSRKVNNPHKGLQRQVAKKTGVKSLQQWTKLNLSISSSRTGEESVSAHNTGEKRLHFCRAHLRVWNGKLIFVKAHWRGNPSIGKKGARYKVTH